MNRQNSNEEEIFRIAREIGSPDARCAYLKQACGHNTALFERIVAILKASEEEDSFLENAASPPVPTVDLNSDREGPGDAIGPYKLLQKIGEGGFGVVYMAEQTEPVRRKVALKIIKPGMDSKDVVARFESERQALAMMSHPNIANVLDGGATDQARPYFVMELVRGVSLTEYCDKKKLSSTERLLLYIDVCHAVQHAHQKGIVHRDLKPSNVMVTLHDGKPVVKVIDFGVAKAINQQLTGKTLFTRYGQMVGTPQYMSPEQAEMSGLDVDTRSDIYSLGVLLYELLVGSTPLTEEQFRQVGYAAMQRLICEHELAKPSTRLSTTGDQQLFDIAEHRSISPDGLRAEICGDLEWIVMKTLEKERERRYPTALELVADIQRYLNDEPVHARPPTFRYRMRKYVRRNRLMVASTAAVASMMLVTTAISAGFAFYANSAWKSEKEQRLAAQQERDAKQKLLQSESALKELSNEQASQLERQYYKSYFQRAKQDFEVGRVEEAREGLQACPEDLRGWEWHRLDALSREGGADLLPGMGKPVFLPGGEQFITVGDERAELHNLVRVWDVDTLECCEQFQVGEDELSDCALTPNGDLLAMGSTTGTFTVLHLPTKSVLWSKRYCNELNQNLPWAHFAFSPSGQYVASAYHTLKIWDARTGNLVSESEPTSLLRDVEFDPSGKYIVTGYAPYSKTLAPGYEIWDAISAKRLTTPEPFGIRALDTSISPDGQLLALAGPGLVLIRSFPDGEIKRVFLPDVGDLVQTVEFSSDGSRLFAAGDLGVAVIDMSDGEVISRKNSVGFENIWWVSLAEDDSKLAIFGTDGDRGVRLLEINNELKFTDSYAIPNSSGWSPTFSNDGSRIAIGDGGRNVRVLDTTTGRLIAMLQGHRSTVLTVRFDRKGDRIYSFDLGGELRSWKSANGTTELEWSTTLGAELDIFGNNLFAVSPDGQTLWVGLNQGQVAKVNAGDGKELQRFGMNTDGIKSIACSNDGRWVAVGTRSNSENRAVIQIWDAEKLGDPVTILNGHEVDINAIAFSPDNNRLASASGDHTVRIWDRENGTELHTLREHSRPQWSVAYSPDGRRLFSTGLDGYVFVWDTRDGSPLMSWQARSRELALSPDGSAVATAGRQNLVMFETKLPGEELLATRRVVHLAGEALGRFDEKTLASEKLRHLENDLEMNPQVRAAAIKMVQCEGDNAYVLNSFAWNELTIEAAGDFELAQRLSKRAVEIVPNCAEYLLTLALGHYRLGLLEEAQATIAAATAAPPNDPRRMPFQATVDPRSTQHAVSAMIQMRLGDRDKATKQLELAKQLATADQLASAIMQEAMALISNDAPVAENDAIEQKQPAPAPGSSL